MEFSHALSFCRFGRIISTDCKYLYWNGQVKHKYWLTLLNIQKALNKINQLWMKMWEREVIYKSYDSICGALMRWMKQCFIACILYRWTFCFSLIFLLILQSFKFVCHFWKDEGNDSILNCPWVNVFWIAGSIWGEKFGSILVSWRSKNRHFLTLT